MTLALGLLFLGAAPLAWLLNGYWLVPALRLDSAGLRLATALLAGLSVTLFALSLVNLWLPLSPGPSALILAPALLTLGRSRERKFLVADLGTLVAAPRAWLVAAGATAFLGLLLWPLLADRETVFVDGSANHDGTFWIAGAEHLQHNSYLTEPVYDAHHPAPGLAKAIVGWAPAWGRMGAEGWLAAAASLTGRSPLELYHYASAAFFLPWLAAVLVVLRTFVSDRLASATLLAMGALQPLFAFYHHNANLPNLVGGLVGTLAIVAATHALPRIAATDGTGRAWGWVLLLALHGLFCTYPEMAPFVLLPLGLLAFRVAWQDRLLPKKRWLAPVLLAAVCALALAIQPATAIRAAIGFAKSFAMARANENWGGLLAGLTPEQFVATLATLSPKVGRELGTGAGVLISLGLLGAAGFAWWKARDRSGLACALSGAAILAIYTLLTGFVYGWQKTIQFAGPVFAALLPLAGIQFLVAGSGAFRVPRRLLAATLAGFFVFATAMVQLDLLKWSDRKKISRDWIALEALSLTQLAGQTVSIDAASFRWSFFHGMWAARFLPGSNLVYAPRGRENGGYLREDVAVETSDAVPSAVVVGRAWADAFDANSPRLLTGREYGLVGRANRVLAAEGLSPSEGVPDSAGNRFSLTLRPHSDSKLVFVLRTSGEVSGSWSVRHSSGARQEQAPAANGRTWHLAVPLVGGVVQRLDFDLPSAPEGATFSIEDLRIVSVP